MDVQTLAQVAAQGLPPDPTSDGSSQSGSVQGALPVPPAPAQGTTPSGQDSKGSAAFHLPQEIAKVFTGGSASHVSISFQVVHDPNEIVTVFKNTDTGEVITQVPSEIMIKMAQFFDQVAGVVLDKSA